MDIQWEDLSEEAGSFFLGRYGRDFLELLIGWSEKSPDCRFP